MAVRLLTTRQAAEWLGVGPTSVKRWADDGRLACVRTAGGHRRFEADVVRAFGRSVDGPASESDALVDLITSRVPTALVQARLLELRVQHGGWVALASALDAVLAGLRARCRDNTLSIGAEHTASERLYRAVVGLAETIVVAPSAPTCVLCASNGEEHPVRLGLAELCARAVGWQTHWAGLRSDRAGVAEALDEAGARVLYVSASVWAEDQLALAKQSRDLSDVCDVRGVRLALGGPGAWSDVAVGRARVTTYDAFAELLADVARQPAERDLAPRREVSSANAE